MFAPSVGLGVLFCHPLRCSAQFRQSKALEKLEIAGILQGCRLVSTPDMPGGAMTQVRNEPCSTQNGLTCARCLEKQLFCMLILRRFQKSD